MTLSASGVKGTPAPARSQAEGIVLRDERPVRQYADSGGTLAVNPGLSRFNHDQWLKSPQTGWLDSWFDRSASIPSPLNDI